MGKSYLEDLSADERTILIVGKKVHWIVNEKYVQNVHKNLTERGHL
jgi:hypothetical protein